MIICGIKATHDASVAVVDGNRLLFSVEVEKLDNGERYSTLDDLDTVTRILATEGIEPADIDKFVVDGWFSFDGIKNDVLSVEPSTISMARGGKGHDVSVAPYQGIGASDPVARYAVDDSSFGSSHAGHVSYPHVASHILGAYCSSPFAARAEDALVLVWDGGTVPRLYSVEAATRRVAAVVDLLPISGNAFGDFSAHFWPFVRIDDSLGVEQQVLRRLSIAGKAMAFAALGRVEEAAYPILDDIIAASPDVSAESAKAVGAAIAARRNELVPGLSDADLIATYQAYLGDRLLQRLTSWLIGSHEPGGGATEAAHRPNMVLAGGCALNIKWNSALRDSGLFADIWIPPFANDSGAAIGTATCEMFLQGQHLALDWDVYSGPRITVGNLPPGWQNRPCDEGAVAEILHREGEPVVVLGERAEIGPRALGNRSIMAPATSAAMKDHLNAIKDRAPYRPVAPMCLTARSAEVFMPGGNDPYMLFEHRPRPEWTDRIPAVLHLDGTARLQTIDAASSSPAGRILAAYEHLSGIPVLCNTSANLNGRGFFPDVASAARWGGTRYIFCDGVLYSDPHATAWASPG